MTETTMHAATRCDSSYHVATVTMTTGRADYFYMGDVRVSFHKATA